MLSELSASIFINELLRISSSIVWKNNYLVIKYEGATTPYDVDMYVSANKGLLTFETIHSFDYSIINGVGIAPDSLIEKCVEDKNNIPLEYREACVNLKIKQINEEYVEKNDYYRMLYGLPSIDDKEYLYCTEYPEIDYRTPIHLLPKSDRIFLESEGYFDQLLEKNKDKKYIAYLGKKNIPPYKSRIADRFSMLFCESSEYDTLVDDFKEMYEQCRLYIIKQFYTEAYRNTQSEYEGFVGMSILFMTIQMMHYKYLDADITRNFYDLDSLKLIYSSYGVPFYPSIPLRYHKLIVRDINRLLSYKGSSRVLFDLFKIFDYGSMEIFQYYIFKIHKFDMNGNPLFIYNEDGSFNNEQMFDISFVKVPFNGDLYLNITDTTNQVDYDLLTVPDKYWVEDQDLKDTLYNNEYNFIESKYMGIQLMFDITRIMFETSYFMKMLLDNKKSTSALSMHFNNINKAVPLFDMVIYAYSLICRKFGYEGNIPSDPEQVAAVYGFNFKEDLNVMKENIKSDKYLKHDSTLYSLISDMNINNIIDVHKVFKNIDELDKYLSEKLYATKDKDEYYAYRNIKNILLTTKLIPEVFKKSNGTFATTYEDLLRDINEDLYDRIMTDGLDYSNEIDYVLSTLKSLSSNLKYIEIVDSMNVSVLIEYLFKMIAFFKSAKSELTDFNIVYTMNSTTLNMFKLLSNIHHIESSMSFEDKMQMYGEIFMIWVMNDISNAFRVYDKFIGSERNGKFTEYINKLIDKLNIIIREQCTPYKNSYYLEDDINASTTDMKVKSGGRFFDRMISDSLKYYFIVHHSEVSTEFKRLCDGIMTSTMEYLNTLNGTYHIDDYLFNIETYRKLTDRYLNKDGIMSDGFHYEFTVHHSEILSQIKDLCDKINVVITYLNKDSNMKLISKINTEEIGFITDRVNKLTFHDTFKKDISNIFYNELFTIKEQVSTSIYNTKDSFLSISESLIVSTIPSMISDKSITKDELVSIIKNLYMKENSIYIERICSFIEERFMEFGMRISDEFTISNSIEQSGIMVFNDSVKKEMQITE